MKHSKTFYTIRTAAVAVIVLAGALGYHFTEDSATSLTDGGLTVTYLDVGQGDATVLQCGGETLLIDGGDNKVEHHLVESLQALGVTELNTIVCTHPHADHVGGMQAVLQNFDVQTLLTPDLSETDVTGQTQRTLQTAQECGVPVETAYTGQQYLQQLSSAV